MNREFALLILFVIISILLLSVVYLFKYLWAKESKIRSYFIKFCISGFTLVYLLLILECFFYFFVIQTDGTIATLSAKRWWTKYWSPINSLGYRDTEHNVFQLEDKKIIFVVGDSFVAGHGIKNYKKRFSNILQGKLGEDYMV